jgi:hypothetical protein
MNCCKHCNIQFDLSDKPKGWMANHVRWCEMNPKRKQYVDKLNHARSCITEESITQRGMSISEAHEQGKYANSPLKMAETKRKNGTASHTEETKLLLSKKQNDYLKNNPDKHPWKNNEKFKSVPCENVKDYLKKNNIDFVEEFKPLEDRHFSLDISFPHIMVALEINGQQHYNSDGTLKDYYQNRHDLIESKGWKIIEVHYSQCFSDENISKFLDPVVEIQQQKS